MSEKKLTKGDRFNMFMRTNLQQASFNYERMHALGMCFDMVPAIKRLYDTKEEQVAALKTSDILQRNTSSCRTSLRCNSSDGRSKSKWSRYR